MTPTQMTANFLRFLSLLQMLTAVIVVIPRAWIASGHAWLGLGNMPDVVSLHYIIRGAAFVQGAIGVLLWVVASDVTKYRPIVITTGAIYLLSAPLLYSIAAFTGMPRYWCIMDSSSALISGGVLLALCRWTSFSSPQRTQSVA